MAKRIKKQDDENESATKNWREGDLINSFHLIRIKTYQTPIMQEWLDVSMPELSVGEEYLFDISYQGAFKSIEGWNEEDLKMKFISPVLLMGHITDDDKVIGYYDKIISATIEDIKLTVKSDFMFAKGVLDVFETPYFHFQEYKPYKNPSGDSMAQLLQAFLIAQEKNKNNKPLYGVDIMGANWRFVTMEGKEYCISKSFDSINKEDLLTIIAILRKFKYILDTRLLE